MALTVDRTPQLLTALSQAANRQLDTLRWLVSYAHEETDRTHVGLWNPGLERPRLVR